MTNVLDGLLDRIDDAALRRQIAGEVTKLRDVKQFGLVFEKHLPEVATLPNHPVEAGRVVQARDPKDESAGVVTAVTGGKAIVRLDGAGEQELPVDDLVVVRRFGEPIHPGLKSLGRLERGGDKPFHAVIKAENYHALQMLDYTHEAAVDCIYIDPPYNLGGDLTYSDKRVGSDDAFRHSKWLSFMDRRLRQARRLLKDTGVILLAIDDTEQAHLRLLMDQVFGEANFIANVVWQGGRKNDAKYVSVGHDYMLVYARSEQTLRDNDIRWREKKPGVEEALAQASEIWETHSSDPALAQKEWRKWLRAFRKTGIPTDAVTRYSTLDERGRPCRTDGNISWPGGGGPEFEVLHPVTGKPCAIPSRGWIFSAPEDFWAAYEEGKIYFGPDHTTQPAGKTLLEEMDSQVPGSFFEQDRNSSSRALDELFGEKRFTHPKHTEVLRRWIEIATRGKPDAVVLDFFVGSGSTVHAVMQLNAADDGSRQCIAVTNNEVDEKRAKKLTKAGHAPGDDEWDQWGIYEHVARPRIETLVTGERPDGSQYSTGLETNVEFLELTYLDHNDIARGRAFADIAPLLWLAAGGRGAVIEEQAIDYSALPDADYAVLWRPAAVRRFVEAIDSRDELRRVYVVTDSDAHFRQVVAELPAHVEPVMLYENYLHSFTINTGGER